MPEIRRISLVLSGGVSLGAYHAGALAEIGYAFALWNAKRDSIEDESLRDSIPIFHVDVIAGASAGCMTGAMFAEFWSQSRHNPAGFVLKSLATWCDDRLLVTNLMDPRTCDSSSLLSTSVIDNIASTAFDFRGGVNLPEGQKSLLLRCMLTDVEGREGQVIFFSPSGSAVDLRPKTYGSSISFVFERSGVSELEFSRQIAKAPIKKTKLTNGQVATRLKWATMASGAFPFAWTPIDLMRQWRDFPAPTGPNDQDSQLPLYDNWLTRTYTDGGVSNNMPLSLAATAMSSYAEMGGTTFDQATLKRTYILLEVSPETNEAVNPAHVSASPGKPGRNLEYTMAKMGMPVFSAAREQTFFLDLQRAARINELLARFDTTFVSMYASVAKATTEPIELRKRIQAHVRLNFGRDFLTEEFQRVEEAVLWSYLDHEALSDLQPDELDLTVTLIAAALYGGDLHLKHEMDVFQIKPTRTLSGAFMGAFGGFMSTRFRREDFRSGIEDAAHKLTEIYSGLGLERFGLNGFDSAMSMPEVQALEQPKMQTVDGIERPVTRSFADVDEDTKVDLGDILTERLFTHFWKMHPIKRFFLKPIIRGVITNHLKL
ncbi:patatin-like phospholipase family protein [Kamptonema cortianum]|nr:patatin-like phospholipase family protein [Geitlerinema splendidum]MDK3156360.1 patatin-like phospholipase family protein [Kamptonema cortianum]